MLQFTNHIQEKINITTQINGIIIKSFKHLACQLFSSLYREIGKTSPRVWSVCLQSLEDVRSTENVQRIATKMLMGMKTLSYEDHLRKLDLATLVDRCMRWYNWNKILHGKYDSELAPS